MLRRVGWLGGCAAVGLLSLPALAVETGPAALFDGSQPMRFDIVEKLPLRLLKNLKGRPAPVVPPADLVAAGKVWANEVQAAKLKSAHPEPKQSFRFAVIGDAEPGRFPWQRIFAPTDAFRDHIRRIQKMDSDFMVQLGDIVSRGVEGNYRKLVEFLAAEARIPMMVIVGNHDRSVPNGDGDKTLFKTVFGKTDLSFDYNGWRFVLLDSADRRLSPEQLAWLAEALSAKMPALVFTHVPPGYLRGRLVSPFADKSYNMSGYFDEGGADFRKLVGAGNVKRVYVGHIHALGTAEVDGVRYVLTAGGGSPLYPLPPGYPKRKTAHFVSVDIGPGGLRETVHELDGHTFPLP
ncbi:MAG: metallophosphoesterase [Elusimicrobia bacterium]|nr:metallophosphoesterase [Elusimicrobiota bacterium]